MDRYPTRRLTALQAFRLAYRASFYGAPALSEGESAELGALTGTMYREMSPRDLERFESYQRRLRRDEPLAPAEDAEMARLMKASTSRLPDEAFRRLQVLFEKAIALGALMERSS